MSLEFFHVHAIKISNRTTDGAAEGKLHCEKIIVFSLALNRKLFMHLIRPGTFTPFIGNCIGEVQEICLSHHHHHERPISSNVRMNMHEMFASDNSNCNININVRL